MPQLRKSSCRVWRCSLRPLVRSHVRSLPGFRRGPDDLSQALTAFSRALRCRRRLEQLAPRFFDSAVVDREALEREEQRRWMATWEPAMNRVYGPASATANRPHANLPPLPGPRTRQAVERELADWSLWMDLGRDAIQRYQQRRPHAIPDLTQLARMLRIASELARHACGLPVGNPATPKPDLHTRHLDAEAALKKIYENQMPMEDERGNS